MTYKDFLDWCGKRACDGCWDSKTATFCLNTIEYIESLFFWKRKRAWSILRPIIEKEVVEAIENRRKELNLND